MGTGGMPQAQPHLGKGTPKLGGGASWTPKGSDLEGAILQAESRSGLAERCISSGVVFPRGQGPLHQMKSFCTSTLNLSANAVNQIRPN